MYVSHLCTYYGVVCMQWVNSCNCPVFVYLQCAMRPVEFAQSCADLWAVLWIGSSLGWPSLMFYWNCRFATVTVLTISYRSVFSTYCSSEFQIRVANCLFCRISCRSSTYSKSIKVCWSKIHCRCWTRLFSMWSTSVCVISVFISVVLLCWQKIKTFVNVHVADAQYYYGVVLSGAQDVAHSIACLLFTYSVIRNAFIWTYLMLVCAHI